MHPISTDGSPPPSDVVSSLPSPKRPLDEVSADKAPVSKERRLASPDGSTPAAQTSVPGEVSAASSTACVSAAAEETTSFRLFSNDDTPEACRSLITLKNIFSKQLPKMPKEYIVRLVLDRRHLTLALMKGSRIIGGVCYRPYFEQRFAEIAFLAISAHEQVRGFGTLLMNELKHHVQPQGVQQYAARSGSPAYDCALSASRNRIFFNLRG